MTATTIDLQDFAARIDAAFPSLTPVGRGLALATQRALALGKPVSGTRLAALTGMEVARVRELTTSWPGVYRNESDAIVGFWGLALSPTTHRFQLGDRTLYTWCAWDSLFLPEILGESARVTSLCAATGADIHLGVGPEGVELPPGADEPVVTLLMPDGGAVDENQVISTFCNHIRFVSSRELGEQWVAEHGHETFVLSLDEAFELGRICNHLRYREALHAS